MQRKKPYHQKKLQAMMGEEKEIKRTLSCQDFVTLHILVQVMCFFGRRCLPRSDSWFSISKNLFFSSRLVENDENVYSCDISHDFDNCTEETRKHGYTVVVYASAPW